MTIDKKRKDLDTSPDPLGVEVPPTPVNLNKLPEHRNPLILRALWVVRMF